MEYTATLGASLRVTMIYGDPTKQVIRSSPTAKRRPSSEGQNSAVFPPEHDFTSETMAFIPRGEGVPSRGGGRFTLGLKVLKIPGQTQATVS